MDKGSIKMKEVKLLLVLDFDHTIIDQNSDIVIRDLIPSDSLSVTDLGDKSNWTQYMQNVFSALYSNNIKRREICDAIRNIPATPRMPELMKKVHSGEGEIIIISDSNSVFIDEWLVNAGLHETVTKVYTNPAIFDSKEFLTINPCQVQNSCSLCSSNICKGSILDSHIEDCKNHGVIFCKVAYAGDGHNDYCPALHLSDHDLVFPREGFALQNKILKSKVNSENKIKAAVHLWNSGTEILDVIEKLL